MSQAQKPENLTIPAAREALGIRSRPRPDDSLRDQPASMADRGPSQGVGIFLAESWQLRDGD